MCRAFLALGDDVAAPAPPRARGTRCAAAVLACVVLALTAPLAWASASADQPLATATKSAVAEDADESDGPGR